MKFVVIFVMLLSSGVSTEEINEPVEDYCKPEGTLVLNKINARINSTFLIGRKIHQHNCLVFKDSVIPRIPSNMFLIGRSNLTTIYANGIEIEELEPENFQNAQYLQRLFLSRNKIKALTDDVFAGCKNLIILDLSKNLISEFAPKSFDGLKNLEILDLSSNSITYVPFELFQDLTNIMYLNLRHNKLNVKYGIFPQFVKTLDIAYNNIDIHHKFKIFALLNNLETLLLHGNKIENFDPVIFENNIRLFGISDNPFSCSTLADIVMLMNSKNIIHVYEDKVKNTSNIQGIKCYE